VKKKGMKRYLNKGFVSYKVIGAPGENRLDRRVRKKKSKPKAARPYHTILTLVSSTKGRRKGIGADSQSSSLKCKKLPERI